MDIPAQYMYAAAYYHMHAMYLPIQLQCPIKNYANHAAMHTLLLFASLQKCVSRAC